MTTISDHPLALIGHYASEISPQQWWKRDDLGAGTRDLGRYLHTARKAEDIGLDALFKADFIGLNRATARAQPTIPFDSLQLAAAVSTVTSRITHIPTVSALFNQPYNVARSLVSLDWATQGRLAWNLVTSFNFEGNYGYTTLPDPASRYRQAGEFLEVVKKLWDSWPPELQKPDLAQKEYAPADRIEDIAHSGEFYRVSGALDFPARSAEHPLLIQAGASEAGIDSALAQADAMFVAGPTIDQAQAFVDRVRRRAEELQRDPDSIRFIFGVRPTLAASDAEAAEIVNAPLTATQLDIARADVEKEIEGLDLSGYPLDEPVPTAAFDNEDLSGFQRRRSRVELIRGFAGEPGQTLRGFLSRISRHGSHFNVVGSYTSFADQLEEWHRRKIADGFILIGNIDLEAFGEHVVPELRRRGVVEEQGQHTTLRDTLGL